MSTRYKISFIALTVALTSALNAPLGAADDHDCMVNCPNIGAAPEILGHAVRVNGTFVNQAREHAIMQNDIDGTVRIFNHIRPNTGIINAWFQVAMNDDVHETVHDLIHDITVPSTVERRIWLDGTLPPYAGQNIPQYILNFNLGRAVARETWGGNGVVGWAVHDVAWWSELPGHPRRAILLGVSFQRHYYDLYLSHTQIAAVGGANYIRLLWVNNAPVVEVTRFTPTGTASLRTYAMTWHAHRALMAADASVDTSNEDDLIYSNG